MDEQPVYQDFDVQAKRLLVASNLGFRIHWGKKPDRVDPHLWLTVKRADLPLALKIQLPIQQGGILHYYVEVAAPSAALDLIDHFLQQAKMPSLYELFAQYPNLPHNR